LESLPELAQWPWLSDMARLEWAVYQASRAGDERAVFGHGQDDAEPRNDATAGVPGLARLADADPACLYPHWAPGMSCLVSHWPIVEVWQAHQAPQEADGSSGPPPSEAQVLSRLAELPELNDEASAPRSPGPVAGVLVRRQGWRVEVSRVPLPMAQFNLALAAGMSLGQALQAWPDTPFQDWLVQALQGAWLAGIDVQTVPTKEIS
jgi:hypothetical protein